MAGSREEEYRFDKTKSSDPLLSRAAVYQRELSRLTPDRQPEAHRQSAETEWRRQRDIQEALKGLGNILSNVVRDLEKFGLYEEVEEWWNLYEEEEDYIEQPPPPDLNPPDGGFKSPGDFVKRWTSLLVILKRWCGETEGYWKKTWGHSERVSERLDELYWSAQDRFYEIDDALSSGGGGFPHTLSSHIDVSYPTTPGAEDYLCWDTGIPGWVPSPITHVSGKEVNYPTTPSTGDYACYDPTGGRTGGPAVTLGPVTMVDGKTINFPTTPGTNDYVCWDSTATEYTSGPVTHVSGKEVNYPTTPSAGDYACYDPTGGRTGGPAITLSPITVDDLGDAVITSPSTGQRLGYNGSNWVNVDHDLDDVEDVSITTPADGEVLTYDSGSSTWVNDTPVGKGWTISQTAPVSPSNGDGWMYTELSSGGNLGQLFIYSSTDSRWYGQNGYTLTFNRNDSPISDGDWLGHHRLNALSSSARAIRFSRNVHWHGATIMATNVPGNTMSITIEIGGVDVHTISWDGSNSVISEDDLDEIQAAGDGIRAFATVGIGTAPNHVQLILEGREYRT